MYLEWSTACPLSCTGFFNWRLPIQNLQAQDASAMPQYSVPAVEKWHPKFIASCEGNLRTTTGCPPYLSICVTRSMISVIADSRIASGNSNTACASRDLAPWYAWNTHCICCWTTCSSSFFKSTTLPVLSCDAKHAASLQALSKQGHTHYEITTHLRNKK